MCWQAEEKLTPDSSKSTVDKVKEKVPAYLQTIWHTHCPALALLTADYQLQLMIAADLGATSGLPIWTLAQVHA